MQNDSLSGYFGGFPLFDMHLDSMQRLNPLMGFVILESSSIEWNYNWTLWAFEVKAASEPGRLIASCSYLGVEPSSASWLDTCPDCPTHGNSRKEQQYPSNTLKFHEYLAPVQTRHTHIAKMGPILDKNDLDAWNTRHDTQHGPHRVRVDLPHGSCKARSNLIRDRVSTWLQRISSIIVRSV